MGRSKSAAKRMLQGLASGAMKAKAIATPVMEAAEVVDIVLDEGHSNYNIAGNINVGAIKARKLHSEYGKPADDLSWYKPLNLNNCTYPLVGEMVLLMKCPSPAVGTNATSFDYMYFAPINLFGEVNSNASHFATIPKKAFGTDFNFLGNIAGSKDDPALGDYFEEYGTRQLNIHEGDTILQGRNGSSIRLGNTSSGADTKPIWGKGKENNPVIVLANGHKTSNIPMDYYYTEDINEDASTIILTSKQEVGLNIKNKLADGVDQPSKYKNGQIILNADQLVLNSKKDLIILSGMKGINITTDKWKADFSTMMDILKKLIAEVETISKGMFPTGVGPTGPLAAQVSALAQIKQEFGKLEQ